MCGITGIVDFNKGLEVLTVTKSMADAIKHRGPDDEGYVFFNEEDMVIAGGKDTARDVWESNLPYSSKQNIENTNGSYSLGLGHRRLSILDLSAAGHQPMCTDDGRFWITYNGEIYNYLELAEELTSKGHQFKTNTDTEVLLHAYLEWGHECVDKFNGMWAFVIYDKTENKLFGSRDRFGVKPFYYIHNDNYFAFASEQKALLKIPSFEKQLNSTAVYDYLVLGKSEMEKESFFKGIMELPPSHSFSFDLKTKNFKEWKYYSLSFNSGWERINKNTLSDYTEEINHLIFNAINIRLRSDVSVGTCLSGGLDSSSIVCVINKLLSEQVLEQVGQKQKVFTAGYDDPAIDESSWAEMVVNQTKTSWHRVYPNPDDFILEFEDMVYAQDIPSFSAATYAQYKVMQLASENGVKVTLDGQGCDELFGGYAVHFTSYMAEAIKRGAIGTVGANLMNLGNNFADPAIITRYPANVLMANLFSTYFKNRGFRNRKKEFQYVENNFWDEHKERLAYLFHSIPTSLNQLLHTQLTGPDLKVLLKAGDRNSMRFSVESRVAFSDDINLIEYVFGIPSSYKVKNGTSKYLLRESMKNILPKEIVQRKNKLGFDTPEKKWFNHLEPQLREIVSTQQQDGFIKWEELNKNWDQLFKEAMNTSTIRLWRLINFALWKKVFQV